MEEEKKNMKLALLNRHQSSFCFLWQNQMHEKFPSLGGLLCYGSSLDMLRVSHMET